MATSDSTALAAIRTDAKIGGSTDMNRGTFPEPVRTLGPITRPNTTKTSTGTITVPITPSGSRTKILISSQVSRPSPRSITSPASVANRVTGQLEKDILERGNLGAEVNDPNPMLRKALNHLRDEIVTATADDDLESVALHRLDLRDGLKAVER